MSTSSSGAAKRSLSSGMRLWPPASTFASSPCSAQQVDRLVERARRLVAEPRRVHRALLYSSWAARSAPGTLGHGDRERLFRGVGPGLLVRRPRPCDGLRRRPSGTPRSPATPRSSGSSPVFGAFSMSSYMRGLPWLCPLDSIAIARPPHPDGARQVRVDMLRGYRALLDHHNRPLSEGLSHSRLWSGRGAGYACPRMEAPCRSRRPFEYQRATSVDARARAAGPARRRRAGGRRRAQPDADDEAAARAARDARRHQRPDASSATIRVERRRAADRAR